MSADALEAALPARPSFGAGRSVARLFGLSVGPLLAALVLSGAFLLALGVSPVEYYGAVLRRGLWSPSGLQESITRMAPLLMLGASLTLAFRAGIWNLGGDGQFLLAAVVVAAVAPALRTVLPAPAVLVLCFGLAALVGATWSLVPALLRAYQGINEIITTLMMTFLGVSLANVLIKLVFLDPATTVPQTRTLAVADRLPKLYGTRVSGGVVIGIVAVLAVHFIMTRTAFGLRLRVVGTSVRAAVHAGLPVPKLTVAVFALSAALAGLSGAVEVLAVEGNVRADWNPAFSLSVVPLVFLARFNGFATIVFVFLFSVLSIGGESAARLTGVPNFFTFVVVAILLLLLAVGEYVDARHRERARV